jgi:uncharacterized membrane protein
MLLDHWQEALILLHLSTIGPAFLMGTYIMLNKKGTEPHKRLGRVYMGLMLLTALVTLLISAQLGPTLFDHFGYIHLLSLLVLYSVPKAYFAIKVGDVKTHKWNMIGLYIGGLLVAGTFALMPGRLLGDLLFSELP